MIFLINGKARSGKDTIADYIVNKTGAKKLWMRQPGRSADGTQSKVLFPQASPDTAAKSDANQARGPFSGR